MTKQELQTLVETIILEHSDELLILLLTQRLNAERAAPKAACACGGNCASNNEAEAPERRGLLLEEDIIALHRQGQRSLTVEKGTIITPLAQDKARDLGIELIR